MNAVNAVNGKSGFLSKQGGILLFALVALAGLLLLLFGNSFLSGKDDTAVAANTLPEPEEYASRVEARVEELCRGVVGDCKVDVAVSLEGGYRSVYVSDSQTTGGGYKSSTVLVGSGSSEGAILVCYENPKISGIGIVISSEENKRVENTVVSLISAAFNVGTNKIHVAFGG